MVQRELLNGSINPFNIFKLINFNRKFYRDNPGYFRPDGLTIFCGPQGSGKTLSAVKYVLELLKYYPNAILVSNIELADYPFDEERVFIFKNADDLSKYNNDKKGVIFLIDEIQLYFNSLDSKNIDPQVMVQISQQRKQRKHIVCTSQVFGRMAKPLREQFSTIILCHKYFNCLQKNSLMDRDSLDGEESTSTNLTGKVIHNYWWFHHPNDYSKYDTYCVIDNNFKDSKGVDIYDYRLPSSNELIY